MSIEELLKAVHVSPGSVIQTRWTSRSIASVAPRWIMGPLILSKMEGCVLGAGSCGVTRASWWIG